MSIAWWFIRFQLWKILFIPWLPHSTALIGITIRNNAFHISTFYGWHFNRRKKPAHTLTAEYQTGSEFMCVNDIADPLCICIPLNNFHRFASKFQNGCITVQSLNWFSIAIRSHKWCQINNNCTIATERVTIFKLRLKLDVLSWSNSWFSCTVLDNNHTPENHIECIVHGDATHVSPYTEIHLSKHHERTSNNAHWTCPHRSDWMRGKYFDSCVCSWMSVCGHKI